METEALHRPSETIAQLSAQQTLTPADINALASAVEEILEQCAITSTNNKLNQLKDILTRKDSQAETTNALLAMTDSLQLISLQIKRFEAMMDNAQTSDNGSHKKLRETIEKTLYGIGIMAIAYTNIPLINHLDIPLYLYGLYQLYTTHKNMLPSVATVHTGMQQLSEKIKISEQLQALKAAISMNNFSNWFASMVPTNSED